VAVFNARKVAAQKACAALDVPLRETPIIAVGADDFADINLGFFFRQLRRSLVRNRSFRRDIVLPLLQNFIPEAAVILRINMRTAQDNICEHFRGNNH